MFYWVLKTPLECFPEILTNASETPIIFIEKRLRHMSFPENFATVAERRLLLKYLPKVKIAAPDQLLVTMMKIC